VKPLSAAAATPAPLAMSDSAAASEVDLEGLFAAHGQRLYRLALRMTGDAAAAEDLVQEAFLRAARRRDRLSAAELAEAWLVRVLVNLVRDDSRRRRTRRLAAPQLPVAERDPADLAAAVAARCDVATALAELPARRRAVVVLHELEELDTAAIARLLGVARVTVRWHLAAGRADLRRRLSADWSEEVSR